MADYYSYLTCAARTDQGRKRKNNEDAYGVFLQHGVFCVADGMGGAEDGEVASQAAVEAVSTMLKRFNPERPLALKAMSAWLSLAVNEASAWIFKRSEERGCRGTGSTFVGVCCDPEKPGVMLSLHAGDSRLYRIRNEEIRQITGDHSAAALAGVKDEKELNPMFRGMVMRAVGVQTAVELERTSFDVKEGDVVLLCSDGLTRMVNDEAICDSVRKAASLDVAVQTLIDAANENGGVDNVTVILIKVGTLPSSIPAVINECPAVCVNEPREKEETNTAGTSDSQEHTDSTQNLGKGPVTPDTPPTGSSHTAETADEKAPAHPEMFEGTRAEGFGRRTVPMGGSAPAEKALWKRLLTVMAAVAAAGLCLFVVVWQAGWLVHCKT